MAVIGNAGYAGAAEELGEVRAVARKVGIDVDVLEIRRAEDIAPVFSTLKSGAQALYVCSDALINANYAASTRWPLRRGCRRFMVCETF